MSLTPKLSLLAVGAAVVIAGCGGSGGGGSSTAASTPAPSSNAKGAQIALHSSKLGKILVDGQGRTLYLFEADKGTSSTCNGACASAWPPVTTSGKPIAGQGVLASKLSTTKRSDGSLEVTYNGHPLYTYVGDQAAGQITGEGSKSFGAGWYVLSPTGHKIEEEGS